MTRVCLPGADDRRGGVGRASTINYSEHVPTRKQRRRRQKTFRHEYGFVTYDEEGNEVEVDPTQARPKKEATRADSSPKSPANKGKGARSGRAVREPPVPSWSRSLRRGALWGGPVVVASIFLLRSTALPVRIVIGAAYAAMFIPLTYWIDRFAYRSFQRRSAKPAGPPKRR
jgi:hypothetical protein